MKKWLTFLLLIVCMAAAFYPCCCTDNCYSDNTTSNHNNHKAEGTCSPFVTCGTCTGFTQLADTVNIPQLPKDKVIHNATVKTFLLLTYSSSLLQPPRIA